MNKRLLASVVGALMLLLSLGALAANASEGVQADGQSATSEQQASAASGATQIDPSNTNIDVRVLSPGDNGSVTQTNSATSDATASNTNDADQSATQDQGSSGGIQTANQWAGNSQLAGSLSTASQVGATNTNIPVRVLSPGSNGSVTQSNAVSSTASSTNHSQADQDAQQTQGGTSCGCQAAPTGVQTSDQSARSGQGSGALSGATQTAPANASDPTAVGSTGSAGTTSQSNSDASRATSTNTNSADQDSSQSQAGSGSGIQTSDQSASNGQLAVAASSASQVRPTNTNISVRVLSPGNDGNVTQSNSVSSTATATNTNSTDQSSDQDPTGNGRSCGCGSAPLGIQVAQQHASNDQAAAALSAASQTGAKNENIPVRVLSPGNGGSVSQSNDVSSTASASNHNSTDQNVDQDQSSHPGCGCQAGGTGIQIADQSSWSRQDAGALSLAAQTGAKNENSPVRVLSEGNDGRVSQSNSVDSTASARNSNYTDQDANQAQSGGDPRGCGCQGGLGIQVLGQESRNEQGALAASAAVQDFGRSECGCSSAGNSNDPVRVWSPGSDGSVSQANSASSTANAANSNSTDEDARQYQSGGSGIGIQALGQKSTNGQGAIALSGAFQLHPSNTNDPTRVYSPGGSGSVSQSNTADSTAAATNTNHTDQDASQSQHGSGGCGCASSLGIQALGQSASNWQSAFALSAALQVAPHNANGGTAVWSPSMGMGSSTLQTNAADSTARGLNRNDADQFARQYQG